jgi:hypothetical protein
MTPDKDQSDVQPGRGYDNTTPGTGAHDGYFIDQNTFGVNSYITESAATFAGLCLICHDQPSLTTSMTWKGHHTVKGWDSTQIDNVFRSKIGTKRGSGFTEGPWSPGDNTVSSEWAMQFYGQVNQDITGSPYGALAEGKQAAMYGSRNDLGANGRLPPVSGQAIAYNATSWGEETNTTGRIGYPEQTTGSSVSTSFHQFPCSKCHNPHASRLKRLMVTNCLDSGAGWNDTTGIHTPSGGNTYTFLVTNGNIMNPEAANCHSVTGSGSQGWNSITPW